MTKSSYVEALTTFQLALNEFGIAHREAWMKPSDEPTAKKSDRGPIEMREAVL